MMMMITTSVFAISPHSWPGSHPPLCPVGSNDNETLYLSYDGNDPDDDDENDNDDENDDYDENYDDDENDDDDDDGYPIKPSTFKT